MQTVTPSEFHKIYNNKKLFIKCGLVYIQIEYTNLVNSLTDDMLINFKISPLGNFKIEYIYQ